MWQSGTVRWERSIGWGCASYVNTCDHAMHSIHEDGQVYDAEESGKECDRVWCGGEERSERRNACNCNRALLASQTELVDTHTMR